MWEMEEHSSELRKLAANKVHFTDFLANARLQRREESAVVPTMYCDYVSTHMLSRSKTGLYVDGISPRKTCVAHREVMVGLQ